MIKVQISRITLPARRVSLDQMVTMTDQKTIKADETIGHGVIRHPGIHRMTLWGFVPQSRPTVLDKSCTAPSRGEIDSFCTKLDRNNYGSMDIRHCKKWNKVAVRKGSEGIGTKRNNFHFSGEEIMYIRRGRKIIRKKCYRTGTPRPGRSGLLQHLFVVPKKDGGLRPILNLRQLNTHLIISHFKMETLRSIMKSLVPGDWAFSVDLTDAYLHLAVHPQYRKYLRFCVQGIHYQFRAMPFGLATAPRLFTKVMSTVGSYLRKQQIYIHMYLDDWLVKHQDRSLLIQHRTMIIDLLQRLGLLINHEKSRLNQTQTLEYLGALVNLKDGIIYPTEIRFLSLQQKI